MALDTKMRSQINLIIYYNEIKYKLSVMNECIYVDFKLQKNIW